MPTTRHRYQITETPAVERALDVAARRWPEESRSRLLLRLLDAGSAALERERGDAHRCRVEVIDATGGKYRDAFGPDYLTELRRDWPE